MIRKHPHGDVTRLELSHARSRVMRLSVSVYLVRGALVDSGYAAAAAELGEALERERPNGAFLTHAHEDHAGNAALLVRRGIALCASAATLDRLRVRRRLPLYRRFTWGTPELLVESGTTFEVPGLRFIHAPGHSADHHVVWDAETGSLFSGDLFLGVKVLVAHATERPRELVRSLRMAISLGPERLFDAHRGLVARPQSALEAKATWLEELIARVEELAARGWPEGAIQRELLGRESLPGIVSAGEYSKRNLVRAVMREE